MSASSATDVNRSEECYRAIVEGANEFIYALTPDGMFTLANPAFERITGWQAVDWIGRHFGELVEESDLALAEGLWKEILSGHPMPPTDLHVLTADGGVRVLQATASPTIKGGRVVQVSGIARDVTGQREMEREREDLMRRLELVLESTDEGLYAVDLDGICTMVNRSACRILGYEPAQLIGRHMHTIMHHTKADGAPFPASECAMPSAMQTGRTVRDSDDLYWTKSGMSFPVETACSAIFENDAIRGAVITFTDISRRRALERQLETANRLSGLGRLAATVAHEFNNVLMGIQPFAEVIARTAAAPGHSVRAAQHIKKSVHRGKRITEEILRFTQPGQPVLRPIDVRSWLADLQVEAQSLLPVGITLAVDDDSRPLQRMIGDPSQLQQTLINLILNARDAMPNGGHLAISASIDPEDTEYAFGYVEQRSRYIHLTVSDSGDGMSSETMRHIFEPLFTTKRNGTGLGLAVTHQVVKRHGGEIFVESMENVGTSFHLFIPCAGCENEMAPPAREVLRKPPARTRLLLVEDDEVVTEGLLSVLALEGIHVDAVHLGALAVEAVSRLAPDAVVLDVGLPDMNGVEVYSQLSLRWPDLPVIFSTGEGDRTKLEKLLNRKNVDYLVKPYAIAELLDHLSRLLSPPQLLSQASATGGDCVRPCSVHA